MNETMIARHIIFTGRVQGVGFRFTARGIASRCGLTGFVRNLPDGTVEMLAQGEPQDVDAAIAQIKQRFLGYIADVRVNEVPYDPQYTDFRITF